MEPRDEPSRQFCLLGRAEPEPEHRTLDRAEHSARPSRTERSARIKSSAEPEPEHGILPESAINYGNNHLNLVSTLLHLVTNPLLLGNKTQKPGNDFPTLQVARCLKNTQSLFC